MAFTVSDFEDLARLLSEHPEWRARLRPLVLGEELLEVPSRLDRVEAVLERLGERLDGLTARVDDLARQMADLVRIEQDHALRLNQIDGRMGNFEGRMLELRYDKNLQNWLGQWLWPLQRFSIDQSETLTRALSQHLIANAELRRLRDADLLAIGQERSGDGQGEMVLAVEVSYTIHVQDVERADEHAVILRRAGYRARGLVGGYRIVETAEDRARELDVVVDLHRAHAAAS